MLGVEEAMPKRKGIDWDEQPLGKVSDYSLARLLGVNDATVRYARHRRGIPAHGRASSPRTATMDRGASKALLSCVHAAVGRSPIGTDELYDVVLNDYGSVSVRQVYRALAVLRNRGIIMFDGEGYVRGEKKLVLR